MQDIVYCAIVFHNPVYALFIRIHEPTSNLYYNQLKELKSFHTSHIDRTVIFTTHFCNKLTNLNYRQ